MRKFSFNLKGWANTPTFTTKGIRCTNAMKGTMVLMMLLFMVSPAFAGGAALTDAANTVRDYLPGIKNLLKAIAVVVAVVGGIRIFNKWQNGDQDVTKEIIGWVGAIIFILLVPTFVDVMFPAG